MKRPGIQDVLARRDTAYHSFRCAVSKLPNEAFKGRVRKRGLVFLRWRFDIDEASPGAPQFFAAQGTDVSSEARRSGNDSKGGAEALC